MKGISFDFSNKRVLITGAGGHLGRAIAEGFSHAGARLVLHGRSLTESFMEFANGLSGDSVILQADLEIPADIKKMFQNIRENPGGLDILINNAALQLVAPLGKIASEDWDRMLAVNLRAPHLCTREFLGLQKNGVERAIINISSIEGENPAVNHSHYDASKGGLIQYTRAAALELGPKGIRVNSVSPGLIDTPGLDEIWPDGVSRYLSAAPLGRLVSTEDVVQAVLFLSSPAAGNITGINLRVDGGVGVTTGY